MFMSIRQYEVNNPAAIVAKVKESLVPLLSQVPGFVSYQVIVIGDSLWTSVTVFDDANKAADGALVIARWVKENDLMGFFGGKPDVLEGVIQVQATRSGAPA